MKSLTLVVISMLVVASADAASQAPDSLIQAISAGAAYRSRVEALAQRAKTQYDPSSRQYQMARALYNNARQQNGIFMQAIQEALDGMPSDETVGDDVALATIAANDYVTKMSVQSTDKSLLVLIPPFVRLLLAVLSVLRNRSAASALAPSLSTQLAWTAWEEL
jgi:hypothetical protein